ncbi:hypothetical protein T484DRAFT_1832211, partial [Baffinella frigidus]
SPDSRTADKLVDGENDTWDPEHMWLAPFTAGEAAKVFILLDTPAAISMIKIWNYSRTPSRGAAEVHVTVDGALAYGGYLARASEGPNEPGVLGQAVLLSGSVRGDQIKFHAILLSGSAKGERSKAILLSGSARGEKSKVYTTSVEQHCIVIDERKVFEGAALVQGEGLVGAAISRVSQ